MESASWDVYNNPCGGWRFHEALSMCVRLGHYDFVLPNCGMTGPVQDQQRRQTVNLIVNTSALIVDSVVLGAVFTQIAACHNGIRLLGRLQQPMRRMEVP